ncbi:Hypothetical predicted protein [Octopus vulgaris]|uniref:Uncharacterized protein n=1 Tax=Octopus vulgaris TaxID=6645 RepID=A0AA36FBG4_OCTVU|nr:Hypothetical predicted protein [Octopus vulgaris]
MHSDINTSNNSSNTNNADNYDMAIEINDSVSGSINHNTALDNNITYNNDNYTHNNLDSSNMRYLTLNNSKSEDYPPRLKKNIFRSEYELIFKPHLTRICSNSIADRVKRFHHKYEV